LPDDRAALHRPAYAEEGPSPRAPAAPDDLPPIIGVVEPVPAFRALQRGSPATTSGPRDAAATIAHGREAVQLTDDRVPVGDVSAWPFRAICALRIRSTSGQQYAGTGFFASPNLVVTAGHCVYLHADGGWAEEIEVIPGLAGADRPHGSYTTRRLRTVDGWIEHQDPSSDYGGIVLDEPVGERVGWFALGALSDAQLMRSWANIAGYPVDREQARALYFHARLLVAAQPTRLIYDIDTFGGQSGSPIWFTTRDGARIVVGLHTNGGLRENSGTRLTGDVLANLRAWQRSRFDGGAQMAV
jgi:glutamyl endopeptidase